MKECSLVTLLENTRNYTKQIKQINPYDVSVVLPFTTAVTLQDSAKDFISERVNSFHDKSLRLLGENGFLWSQLK